MSETKLERYGFNHGQPRCLVVENGVQCPSMAIADQARYGGPQVCVRHRNKATKRVAFEIAKGLNTGN